MLARLKLPFSKIRKAILGLDETILTRETVRVLHSFKPTSDEVPPSCCCHLDIFLSLNVNNVNIAYYYFLDGANS